MHLYVYMYIYIYVYTRHFQIIILVGVIDLSINEYVLI